MSVADYLGHVSDAGAPCKLPPSIWCIVVAEGEIVDGDAGPGRIGGDSTARLIRKAREDDRHQDRSCCA